MTLVYWLQDHFREPWFLLAGLLALPIFWLSYQPTGHVTFSSFRLLPERSRSWRTMLSWLPDLLLALGAVAMAIALAGPRSPTKETKIKRRGISIMMVVDLSGSMEALDLSLQDRERTRLQAVQDVFAEFVRGDQEDDLGGRPDDSIGIVSFAGYADTRCPLTLNHESLLTIAEDLAIVSEQSEDGTAIGDGLGMAVERLREAKTESKVAILLTDGVNNTGYLSPMEAAALAREQGIKVYTIGAGTNGRAPVRVRNPFTGGTQLRGVPVEIDEKTLQAIAKQTDGRYFRATDAEALANVYSEIDALERTEIVERTMTEYHLHFQVPLGIALLLIALGLLARATVFRRLPC